MTVKDVNISNFQIKQLFELFNNMILEPGENAKFSWMVYQNTAILAPLYADILQNIYDENRDPEFSAFYSEQDVLIQKYADRDNNNIIKVDTNNKPIIKENIIEFSEENKKLIEKYPELYKRLQSKNENNANVYKQTKTIPLHCLELSEFPPKTIPFIVGLLGY